MEELKEQPLGYWEEESYMLVVPRQRLFEYDGQICGEDRRGSGDI